MPFKQKSSGNAFKKLFSGFYSPFYETLIDNSDGKVKGRRGMMFGNYFASIASSMISGMYFTGLLLKIGASDEFIGYINMIISSCTFLQMVSPLLLERFAKRKKILLSLRIFNYFLNIIFISIVPFLPISSTGKMTLIMIAIILIYTINALSAPGISIWHMQSVPHEKRANYFSLSSIGSALITTPIGFLTSLLLDSINAAEISLFNISPELFGFYVLRFIAIFAAIFEIKLYLQIKEYPYEKSQNNKINLSMLILPLKNKSFMMVISVMFMWNLMGSLIGQYYTIYCLDIVKLSYTYLNFASMFSMPITVLMTPIWAKLINRFGWFKILACGMVIYSFAIISNVFVTANSQYVYFLVTVFCSLAGPAISINSSNIPYMKMPETNRTVYLCFYTVFTALGTVISSFLSIQLFKFTQNTTLNIFGMKMLNYQYLCILQGFIALAVVLYVVILRAHLRKNPENASLNL